MLFQEVEELGILVEAYLIFLANCFGLIPFFFSDGLCVHRKHEKELREETKTDFKLK